MEEAVNTVKSPSTSVPDLDIASSSLNTCDEINETNTMLASAAMDDLESSYSSSAGTVDHNSFLCIKKTNASNIQYCAKFIHCLV